MAAIFTNEFTAQRATEFGEELISIGKKLKNGNSQAIVTANPYHYYKRVFGRNKATSEQLKLNKDMKKIKAAEAAAKAGKTQRI